MFYDISVTTAYVCDHHVWSQACRSFLLFAVHSSTCVVLQAYFLICLLTNQNLLLFEMHSSTCVELQLYAVETAHVHSSTCVELVVTSVVYDISVVADQNF